MPSRRLQLFACVLIMLVGCNERLPIEPVSSIDDDWTPTFTTTWYGYQRIALAIDGPPRKELVPNIARYILSVQDVSDTLLLPIDTLEYVAPSYVHPGNHSTDMWLTHARVPYGKAYYPWLTVQYRNGTVRRQSGFYLAPDMGRGTILRRFSVESAPSGSYPQLGERVAIWRSRPIFNRDEHVYVVDTTSGAVSTLTSLLPPLPAGTGGSDPHRLRALGVDGDTLVAAIQVANQYRVRLHKIDLNTLASDTSISISFNPTLDLTAVATAAGRCGLLFRLPGGQSQLVQYDTRTGSIVQTYPPAILADEAYDRLYDDGTDYWVLSWQQQESPAAFYPIKRLDPVTLSFTLVHRNPVENTWAFAIQPPFAWVGDYGTGEQTLAKVRLEGF